MATAVHPAGSLSARTPETTVELYLSLWLEEAQRELVSVEERRVEEYAGKPLVLRIIRINIYFV